MNGEVFYILAEVQILIEAWRRHYNTFRKHSSLGYRSSDRRRKRRQGAEGSDGLAINADLPLGTVNCIVSTLNRPRNRAF
ncbi:integrase core domain-containing protein [Sphingorhabdus sp.]|uniref:integrase core domain-containing protein n=1 Tax=Sphingorhabdus sp. TaxID=1902408 RepID=UPI0038FC4A68